MATEKVIRTCQRPSKQISGVPGSISIALGAGAFWEPPYSVEEIDTKRETLWLSNP
jgi:hypothetical protein